MAIVISEKKMTLAMSDFICQECGRKGLPCWRKTNQQRENGHIKDLYCIYCGKITKHKEIKNV